MFGQPANQTTSRQQGTTGVFGQQANQPVNTGLFGQQPNQPATGVFGQPATQATTNQQTTGLFGQKATQPTAGLFGQPATNQQTTGLFGQQNTQPAAQATTGLFGQPTTGLFGQPAAQQTTGLFGQQTNQPATGLFGQQTTGLFGQPATQQNTGLFGQPATQGGLFGQKQTVDTSLFNKSTQPGATFALTMPQAGQSMMSAFNPAATQQPAVILPGSQFLELTVQEKLLLLREAWDIKSQNCQFQHYMYNMVHPDDVKYYKRSAADKNEALWIRAQHDNPDPTCMVPVLAVGFGDLSKRVQIQSQQQQDYTSKLQVSFVLTIGN